MYVDAVINNASNKLISGAHFESTITSWKCLPNCCHSNKRPPESFQWSRYERFGEVNMIPVHVLHKNKSAVRRQFDLLVQCTVLRTTHQESLCIWEEKSQANLFVSVFFLAKFCCLYPFWWNLLHLSIWNVICLEVSILEETLTVDYCLLAQSPIPGILLGT